MLQALTDSEQMAFQFLVIHILSRNFFLDGNAGGEACTLAKDHEHGFHADGAIGDV